MDTKPVPNATIEEQADVYALNVVRALIEFCKLNNVGFKLALDASIAIIVDLCEINKLDPSQVQDAIEKRYDMVYGKKKAEELTTKDPLLLN